MAVLGLAVDGQDPVVLLIQTTTPDARSGVGDGSSADSGGDSGLQSNVNHQ